MAGRDMGKIGEQEGWSTRAPRVSDALKRGVSVSVDTWGGRRISGRVCDREPYGLLLDVESSEGEPGGSTGYVFLPWTSMHEVSIQDVVTRRVKYLRDG